MSAIRTNAAAAAVALAAIVAAASAAGTGNAASASGTPDPRSDAGSFRCEIQAKGGALAAVVHADVPLTGTYSFKVAGRSSGGSSNINQGGPFAAGMGDVTLGQVSLGAGAAFTATLTVTANGATATCSEPKTAL